MTVKEAERILATPCKEFNIGDTVYLAEFANKVIKVVVKAKRPSKIGLPPCYSLESKELNKTINRCIAFIYDTPEQAEVARQAICTLREDFYHDYTRLSI